MRLPFHARTVLIALLLLIGAAHASNGSWGWAWVSLGGAALLVLSAVVTKGL